jgi:hypothetical protein
MVPTHLDKMVALVALAVVVAVLAQTQALLVLVELVAFFFITKIG